MVESNSTKLVWQKPSPLPYLSRDRVHLWCANLDLTKSEIKQLANFLSADEVERANRFRFPQHCKRFIVARGILRQLLGNYLKVDPQDLIFTYGEQGKPLLTAKVKSDSLEFNISHSQEYALFGFTLNHSLGVDLEYQRQMPDALKIARRFLLSPRIQTTRGDGNRTAIAVILSLLDGKRGIFKSDRQRIN